MHVSRVLTVFETFKFQDSRPRWRDAYNEVAKSLAATSESPIQTLGKRAWQVAVGQCQSGKGIGRDLVLAQLELSRRRENLASSNCPAGGTICRL
jgi:hypothetical protein